MRTSQARFLLWSAAAGLGGAAVFAAAWGVLGPYEQPIAATVAKPASRPAGPPPDPPLAAFEELWDIELDRPLVDAAPPASAVVPTTLAAPPALPAGLKLVGTVVEPGHSMAVFGRADGKTEVRGVGEAAGGAEVLRIDADRVTVRYQGQTTTLRIDPAARDRKG